MIVESPLTGEREVNSCIEKVESTYLPLPCNRLIKVVKTRFKIPLRFTTFKRTRLSEKILTTLIKRLYGRGK